MSKVTHGLALTAAAIGAWFLTPAGKALILQYPWLASAVAFLAIFGIYHTPQKS